MQKPEEQDEPPSRLSRSEDTVRLGAGAVCTGEGCRAGWGDRGCLSAGAAAALPPSGTRAAPLGLPCEAQGGHVPVGGIQTFLRLHLCTRVPIRVWGV